LWIVVCPNITNIQAIHDVMPDILHILTGAKIINVITKWSEASVDHSTYDDHQWQPQFKFSLNHPFNTSLSIPISKQSRASSCLS